MWSNDRTGAFHMCSPYSGYSRNKARSGLVGVLVLVRDDPSTPFVDEDLSLAGMLAARAGLAVDNARLYAEREYVAETLRRSLLPQR